MDPVPGGDVQFGNVRRYRVVVTLKVTTTIFARCGHPEISQRFLFAPFPDWSILEGGTMSEQVEEEMARIREALIPAADALKSSSENNPIKESFAAQTKSDLQKIADIKGETQKAIGTRFRSTTNYTPQEARCR